jgi:hypothetical protein
VPATVARICDALRQSVKPERNTDDEITNHENVPFMLSARRGLDLGGRIPLLRVVRIRSKEPYMRVEVASLARSALCAVGFAAFIAGCGGSQPPIGAADMRQPTMQRATSSGDALLYVMMGESSTHILTYPGLEKVKRFPGWGLSASNPNTGDVLIGGIGGDFSLYAHGGTKPLHVFQPNTEEATFYGCAFDPTSDAIALTGNAEGGGAFVYVYEATTSTPTKYTLPNMRYLEFAGYDDQGDLFVDGYPSDNQVILAELPKGASAFVDLTIDGTIKDPRSIQWDGSYITVFSTASIYRLQVSGSTATIVGRTKLTGAWGGFGQFWIQNNTVIGPHASDPPHNGRWVGFWHYPDGGRAYTVLKTLSKDQQDRMSSATVSIAPSR